MPIRMNIKRNWSAPIQKGMQAALLEMTTDIHRKSIILVPKDTRALANSGKIQPIADGYAITYGSDRVPYARIHELGGYTGRGLATRIPAKHYLRDAGESVARGNKAKYFRGKV